MGECERNFREFVEPETNSRKFLAHEATPSREQNNPGLIYSGVYKTVERNIKD